MARQRRRRAGSRRQLEAGQGQEHRAHRRHRRYHHGHRPRHARPGGAAAGIIPDAHPAIASSCAPPSTQSMHSCTRPLRICTRPLRICNPAAGADQGRAHLMTVFRGAVDAMFAAFGIEANYTGRRRAGPGAGNREASRHHRRLRRDPYPRRDRNLRVRAGEVASPAQAISSPSAARPSSSRASRSGAIPIDWCGRSTSGPHELAAQVGHWHCSTRLLRLSPRNRSPEGPNGVSPGHCSALPSSRALE